MKARLRPSLGLYGPPRQRPNILHSGIAREWFYSRLGVCVHSTRVVFNPSKVKIRVRVPVDAVLFSLHFVHFCIKITKTTREIRRGVRVWSSPVMTPASHAGNPEFESRHAYAFFPPSSSFAFTLAVYRRAVPSTLCPSG